VGMTVYVSSKRKIQNKEKANPLRLRFLNGMVSNNQYNNEHKKCSSIIYIASHSNTNAITYENQYSRLLKQQNM